ncbi:TonB-dependent receptor [uncultured Draconibacterium sp.]|uniref:TonB-dependent receptor n=1 Tax=uncultured Draconibacterium sp. TaxID=1573823 RepID=UPI003216470B
MRSLYLFSLLQCLTIISSSAQKVTISGYISDVATGEMLINANVYAPVHQSGNISNVYGFYSVTLPAGDISLQYSFVGYEKQEIKLNTLKDTVLNVSLKLAGELDEIVVSANKSKVERTQMSMVEIQSAQLQKLPVLFGEPDVLKVIQLLPGVQSGAEGTSGIYVRGGGPDQNLFLLDGVPVYNASHLFGFFSVFNPSAVKTVKLYKGGFPARFGGRLSSVVDIRMKEGNFKEFKGEVSVGLISSRFSFEGPIVKDKTSFIVSGRRTYVDILAQPAFAIANKQDSEGNVKAGYYFYDLNAKINHKFSDRSRLYLSTYMGRDKAYSKEDYYYVNDHTRFDEKYDMGIGWGNITSALRWNYVYNPKLFSNATLTYSRYNFDVKERYKDVSTKDDSFSEDYFQYLSGINDVTTQFDFDYYPGGGHSIKFGASNIWHKFKPGVNHERSQNFSTDPQLNKVDTTYGNANVSAMEFSAFIEDNYKISPKFQVNLGLHFSMFHVQNTTYKSLQPRVSLRYLVNDRLSFKASYAKMSQYIHLLSSSTVSLPTDLWLPATANVKPQNSHQFAFGTSLKLAKGYDFTAEAFYKTMDNLIEYKEGSSFSGVSKEWESKIETGEGWSYGAEFLLEKNIGKTTGWIGYTLSWANRKFENLNFGETFPAKYDRRHDLSLALTHKFSDKFDIGLTWVYGTGNAVTLGVQKYPSMLPKQSYYFGSSGESAITYYDGRNGYRMPSYHRMDISMNFHKQKKRGVRTWSLGLYNAYSRQNPFYLYWGHQGTSGYNQQGYYFENSKPALKQVSLFPVLPSVSYTFKF